MAYIKKRGDTYLITVSDGRDAEGKKITRSATFRPDPELTDRQNQKNLEYFVADFERSVHAGASFDGEKITFAEFVQEWRTTYAEGHIRAKTRESYEQVLRDHIIPEIGHLRLAKIKAMHLNKLYAKLSQERKDGRPGGYPASTIKRVAGVIGSVMTYAVKCEIIDSSPCRQATIPRDDTFTQSGDKCFTDTEAAAFLAYMKEPFTVTRQPKNRRAYTQIQTVPEQIQVFLMMAALTGCRRSELIALTWEDVDFDKGILRIEKATTITRDGLKTDIPKTHMSFRKISIDPLLVDALRSYRSHQLQNRLRIGSKWEDGNFLFTQWNGRQMRPETPYREFKSILQRYNATHEEKLPDINLHGLRHTSATLLISQGVDVKTVSSRLGHSRVGTTLDIYAHALEARDRAAAATLSDLLYKSK